LSEQPWRPKRRPWLPRGKHCPQRWLICGPRTVRECAWSVCALSWCAWSMCAWPMCPFVHGQCAWPLSMVHVCMVSVRVCVGSADPMTAHRKSKERRVLRDGTHVSRRAPKAQALHAPMLHAQRYPRPGPWPLAPPTTDSREEFLVSSLKSYTDNMAKHEERQRELERRIASIEVCTPALYCGLSTPRSPPLTPPPFPHPWRVGSPCL
jgi:hypothetical protein